MLYPYSPTCHYKKAMNIILKKVFVEKVINTTIKKNTMRKLIKDICKKTAFIFDNVYGVSMESPLAAVLANIIITELESNIIKKLFDTRKITFYCR